MTSKAEIRGALLALGGLLVLVLLIISFTPGLPGELLLQSLRFHVVVVGVLLVLALVVMGSRWRAGLLLIAVAAGAVHGGMLVTEFHGRRQAYTEPPKAELVMLSYNVLNGNPRAAEAAQHIIELAPDIALVMETPGIEPYLDQIASVLPYRAGCENASTCDISLHSRLPLENVRMVSLNPFHYERLLLAETVVGGERVTIVGIHLSKPYFDQASWIESYGLRRTLAAIEGPVVLAGDFNSAPWSDPLVYVGRRQNLIPPPGHPATWPVRLWELGVPIDNMFTRGTAQIIEISAGERTFGSNHRYLLARIGLYAAP